jgi:hypothetical protein
MGLLTGGNIRQQAIDQTRTSNEDGTKAIALAIVYLADTLRELLGKRA